MAKTLGYDNSEWVTALILGIILFVLWVVFSGGDGATPEEKARSEQSKQESNIKWAGRLSVQDILKDPDSAEFRGVFYSEKGGVPMACGEVNSKNSMGGFTGFQRFVSRGTKELTVLEEQVAGFQVTWNEFCK